MAVARHALSHWLLCLVTCAPLLLQGLILYSALTCASTPVALRYLYLQDQPPAAPVLAAVQTSFAAVILVLISGLALPWVLRRSCHIMIHASLCNRIANNTFCMTSLTHALDRVVSHCTCDAHTEI